MRRVTVTLDEETEKALDLAGRIAAEGRPNVSTSEVLRHLIRLGAGDMQTAIEVFCRTDLHDPDHKEAQDVLTVPA